MKSRSVLRWTVLAILACAGLYLVGNSRVPLWDRDEPWYAQCSLKMILDGDYVVPRYLDGGLRTEKPPLIYWLQAASMHVFGAGEFAPRLVSGVAMTSVLILVALVLWRMVGPRRAAWTTFILGTSAMVILSAKMCLTDAVLLLFITIAQFCLMMFYRGRGSPWVMLILALSLAMGFYDKGPVVFVAPASTLVVLAAMDWRRWTGFVAHQPREAARRTAFGVLGIFAGLGAVTVFIGPWAWQNFRAEPQWIPGILHVAEAHVGRAMDGHSGFYGWYLVAIWGVFFPWSLLLPTAAVIAFFHRKLPEIRFAIAAVLGPLLFHELIMKTKLPHYLLPALPFLAFLTADALVRCIRRQYDELERPRFKWATLAWALILGLLPSIVWLPAFKSISWWRGVDMGPLPWVAMAAVSIFGFVYTLGVWRLFARKRAAEAAGWMGAGFVLLFALMYGWYLPSAPFLATSKNLAGLLHQVGALASDGAQKGDVATLSYSFEAVGRDGRTRQRSIGWREPSLDFYQGGTLWHVDEDRFLERHAAEYWPRVMIIPRMIWDVSSDAVRSRLRVVGKVRGLSYAANPGGVELWVVERTAAPEVKDDPIPALGPTTHPADAGAIRPDQGQVAP